MTTREDAMNRVEEGLSQAEDGMKQLADLLPEDRRYLVESSIQNIYRVLRSADSISDSLAEKEGVA